MLATEARAANKKFTGSACDNAKVEVVSITPWQITNHPEWIVWREKVRVAGCGHTSNENVNVGRLGGTPPWRMTTGLPGVSLADMTLQESTYPAALAQARDGLPADCQAATLSDVYVAARAGGVDLFLPGVPLPEARNGRPALGLPETAKPFLDRLDLSGAWMEVWPFEVCGHDRALGVVFIPLKDQSARLHLFLPVWQHGPGSRPDPAPADQ
jgi:hypothetical protein